MDHPWGMAPAVIYGRKGRTFEEAAESYVRMGGSARYMPAVIEHFRGKEVGTIAPTDIRGPARTSLAIVLPD